MKIPQGFLAQVFEMLKDRYPRMNEDYLLGIAEVLLSSACWKVYTIDDYGQLAPNIWLQMIAPSGDGKSLLIDYFLIPTLEELEKLITTEDTIYKLYIADYTKEGILRHFSGRTKRKNKDGKAVKVVYIYGMLCKDEATMFLEAATKKNYMADIIAVESKMYDGKLYRKITAGRGLEEVPKCFKANIAATTPAIYSLMKTDAFIQGGWNRYDMIIGNPLSAEDVEELPSDFFVMKWDRAEEFGEIPYHYAEQLVNLVNDGRIYVAISEEASQIWREYEKRTKQEAVKLKERDLRRGYLQRQAEKALKRAMLYTISRWLSTIHLAEKEDWADAKFVLCDKDEMSLAIHNQDEFYKYWLKMLSERIQAPTESVSSSDEADIVRFEGICQALSSEFNDGLFSRPLLVDRMKKLASSKTLRGLISTFMTLGKLKVHYGEDSRKICKPHFETKDTDWFERQMVSTSFKNPPHFYQFFEKGGSVDSD